MQVLHQDTSVGVDEQVCVSGFGECLMKMLYVNVNWYLVKYFIVNYIKKLGNET